jgi:hypothetical protein
MPITDCITREGGRLLQLRSVMPLALLPPLVFALEQTAPVEQQLGEHVKRRARRVREAERARPADALFDSKETNMHQTKLGQILRASQDAQSLTGRRKRSPW